MEADNALINQWEPKIQRFLGTSFVLGLDREDLAQELRIAIVKAAEGFDEDRGVSFHTYLHTTMVNTLRTLITKAQKRTPFYEAYSLDYTLDNVADNFDDAYISQPSTKILQAVIDPVGEVKDQEFEVQDLLIRSKLNDLEIKFINLRIEGLTMEEIRQELNISPYKLRHSSKRKLAKYLNKYDWLEGEHAYTKKGKEGGSDKKEGIDKSKTNP